MENVPDESLKPLWKGMLGGFLVFGGFIFPDPISTITWVSLIIKFSITISMSGVSGLASMLVADFYKKKIQNRIFKTKKHGKRKPPEDEEKVA